MWEEEVRGTSRFQDIQIVERRLPIIRKLEEAIIGSKPKNTLHFIKKWAQKESKELENSSQQDQKLQKPTEGDKNKANSKMVFTGKRRKAIVMAKTDENEQWIQFLNKEPLLKNQECKSRIMISLREIPFLVGLGWDDINQLVDEAEMREYYQNETFVRREHWINRLYILLHGELMKTDSKGRTTVVNEGSNLFMQSIISLIQASSSYHVSSDKVWICGIESYRIYDLLQNVNKRKEDQYEKMLMGVSLFSTLDKEEFYKLICMIKLTPVKRANDIILDKDDPVDKLYLVLKGQFLLCKKNLSNEITTFQTYREGQFFGQNWVIKPIRSEYAVVAKSEGQLGVISREDIEMAIAPIERLLQRKDAKRILQSK